MIALRCRHCWPEKAGFKIERPNGITCYNFLHFWESFEITLNGETFETKPHGCILYKPNTPQFYKCNVRSTQDWIRISGNVAEEFEKYGLKCNTIYYPRNFEFITKLFRKLEKEMSAGEKYSNEICEAYLHELFITLSREIDANQIQNDINLETIKRLQFLRQELHLKYNQDWKISDMAKMVNLSPSYLHSLYKRYYGVSPVKDLISIRIEKSKTLLTSSSISVNEIALQLGYTNTSHYIRQFIQIEGISPAKYRKKNILDKRNIF